MATALMKQTVKNCSVASIKELRGICVEAEVKRVACQMNVELFGCKQDDFIPEVKYWK